MTSLLYASVPIACESTRLTFNVLTDKASCPQRDIALALPETQSSFDVSL